MSLVFDITVVLAIAAFVLYFCLRLKLPTIVAFLVAGMLAGPHGLALVKSPDAVSHLAEVGVILLLFTIGIEFSIEKMISSRRFIFIGGTMQLVLTVLAFFLFSVALNTKWNQALFIGFLFCLSSTAIVLQLFQETNQIESLHGRVSLSILIFQDIAIVPLMLVLPWISGKPFKIMDVVNLLLGFFVVAVVIWASRRFMPRIIQNVVHTRNRELFLLFVIVLCFVMAIITHSIDLSLALGAFLAGLVISESEFSHEALSNVLPLKKIFTSIFFISVGMLLDLNFFIHQPFRIIGITIGVIILKILVVLLVGLFLKMPGRSIVITALALCQVGEFAFVLAGQGQSYGLLNNDMRQVFLAVSIISMGVSPFIIQFAPKLAARFTKVPSIEDDKDVLHKVKRHHADLRDHLVIIGFGTNGQNVVRAAKVANIPYVIIDFNPDTYRKQKQKGESIVYGDATNEEVLEIANADVARIIVVATHDPIATEMIVSAIRKVSPKARLIVRTRFMNDVEGLRKLGADEVIPEEFETSIEIFTRVMKYYLVPDSDIEKVVQDIRNENYEMLRKLSDSHSDGQMPFLSVMDVARLHIDENSKWVGQSIEEIMLRKKFAVTAIAILRHGEYIHNPPGSTVIIADDELLVIGLPAAIAKLSPYARIVA